MTTICIHHPHLKPPCEQLNQHQNSFKHNNSTILNSKVEKHRININWHRWQEGNSTRYTCTRTQMIKNTLCRASALQQHGATPITKQKCINLTTQHARHLILLVNFCWSSRPTISNSSLPHQQYTQPSCRSWLRPQFRSIFFWLLIIWFFWWTISYQRLNSILPHFNQEEMIDTLNCRKLSQWGKLPQLSH